MDKRNGRSQPQRSARPSPQSRRPSYSTGYDTQEIDRYNYVDRDIYSNSRPAQSAQRPKKSARYKKRKNPVKKFLLTVLCLVIIAGLAVVGYGLFMSSRLDRSDSANTAAYVQQTGTDPTWGVISDKNVTNILLIGIDKNEDGTDGRSDTNMLLSIDNNTKAIHLVSFLRDTYLEIPNWKKDKLNAAFAHGGPALTIQTLEKNYGIKIDNYIAINSDHFETLIDKMGGLDIQMDKAVCGAMNRNMGSHLKPGVNHLDGRLALYYARIREIDSDFGRTGRQREVVELMIKKVKAMNLFQVNQLVYDYTPSVKTNLSTNELIRLASIAGPVSNYPVKTMHVPNTGTYKDETIKGSGQVLVPDLPKNCDLLKDFLYSDSTSSAEQTN